MSPTIRFLPTAALASLLAACAPTGVQPGAAIPATPVAGTAAPSTLSEEDRIAFFVNAARTGDDAYLRQALAEGIAIDARDALDQTALIAAVSHDSPASVRLLLEHGASPAVADTAGWTPLLYAAFFGAGTEILQALLDHHAAIDARNDRGITALYLASAAGHAAQVELLLARGADRSIASASGYTPLRVARTRGFDGIVALLDPPATTAPAHAAH